MANIILKKILPVCALLGTVLISLALYRIIVRLPIFLTTSSPDGTYTVNLTGHKERPYFFTNTVYFQVLKHGKSFLSDKYFHSGDSFDLSFEAGYPDHHWVSENAIQFYRKEYFNKGKPDTLKVVNNTREVVKYLQVESVDKFLLFDLPPGAVMELLNSRPRGSYKSIGVIGEFSNGRSVGKNGASFETPKGLTDPMTYHIYITDNGPTFESTQFDRN